MKISTLASFLALIISAISLYVVLSKVNPSPEIQADKAATAALQVREKEFIKNYQPRFEELYSEQTIEGKELINKEWNPQTIEELFAPTMDLIFHPE